MSTMLEEQSWTHKQLLMHAPVDRLEVMKATSCFVIEQFSHRKNNTTFEIINSVTRKVNVKICCLLLTVFSGDMQVIVGMFGIRNQLQRTIHGDTCQIKP